MTQLIDFIVNGGILFNVRIGMRDIRLRLIIIVVETKNSTALFGKNSLNSLQSWAARILLCASTSVGLLTFWMRFATVNVFPEPVTPRSICSLSPRKIPSASRSIASG